MGRKGSFRVVSVLLMPAALPAQSVTVTGQVLHGAEKDRPVARQVVVLHQIRRDSGGPVDSTRTDPAGRYRLTIPRADTSALYLVSTLYQGVAYFSRELRVQGRGRTEAEPLVVYDTTVGGPPMRLDRRLLTLFQAGKDGGRTVLELIEITNPGDHTRIARDSSSPVWTVALPAGAMGWEAGEGDLSPEALRFSGDLVQVFAPIWPGAPRQTSFQYSLTGSTVTIPVDQWTRELDLLIEDSTAQPAGALFESLGTHDVEGRRFTAYQAGPLDAGTEVAVRFRHAPFRPERLVPFVAGAAGLALAVGLWIALKRKPSAVSHQPSAKRPTLPADG
jgi:hypothetical protein